MGTGGVGKTSVGFELARTVAGGYPDGVFVVELVSVVDRNATLGAFATALDVNTPQQSSIDDAIVDMLRPRHALLLLDNCEHLVELVGPLVESILRAAPRVSVVATSREPLGVTGEHVWTAEPLATADLEALPTADLAAVPAVALFAAQVLGAIEAHTTLGGPPVMTALRDLAFETRDSLSDQLGEERTAEQRAKGASLPVVEIVDRTRNALLGRTESRQESGVIPSR